MKKYSFSAGIDFLTLKVDPSAELVIKLCNFADFYAGLNTNMFQHLKLDIKLVFLALNE